MTCKEAHEKAREIDTALRADNPIFRNFTRVIHEEGTISDFEWASGVKLSEEYFAIFTEHHGFHVYHEDNANIIMYKRLHRGVYSLDEIGIEGVKPSKGLSFWCDDIDELGNTIPNSGCGRIDSVIFDGYIIGDRIPESVLFRVFLNDSQLQVEPVRLDSSDKENKYTKIIWKKDQYLLQLDEKYWMDKALAFAMTYDVAQCCLCGDDVDPKPREV